MLGEEGSLSKEAMAPIMDSLTALSRHLRGKFRARGDEAILRQLMALVEHHVRNVYPSRGLPIGNAQTDGPALRRRIVNVLGKEWCRVTDELCTQLIDKWSQRPAEGRFTMVGIAREIVLASKALAYSDTPDGRVRLDRDLDKAVRRKVPTKGARRPKPRQKARAARSRKQRKTSGEA
jgi:hypothetical protein